MRRFDYLDGLGAVNLKKRFRMKRLIIFDILRGILLLMMIVDHSPSQLRLFTDQPIGFFTTAEGFVFVSAFLSGMLFLRRTQDSGLAAPRSGTFSRAMLS